MRYLLRHVVLEHRWRAQLADLIELVAQAGVDEVMLMEQSHQIVTVPFTLDKHRRMAAIYREYVTALRPRGVEVSVNLATIVGHSDAPVAEEDRLPFTRWVGEDLEPATAVYCIGDPGWVSYACEVAAIYAGTHPRRLMVDDDFRSLNHSTAVGCFCPLHVEGTVQALGEPVMSPVHLRGALLENSDRGQQVKTAWLAVTWRMQLEAARAIERAVHEVDPDVQVGLMNSGEPAHALQGRDMAALLGAFAGPDRPPLSRPAGGAYADGLHDQVVAMHQTSALSRHAAGGHGTWVSEVENWPHSRYLKSVAVTRLQLELHALWGADAVTLNLFDYLGTPFALEPQWGALLVEARAHLGRIQAVRRGKVLDGVSLPWTPDAARHRRNRAGTVEGLVPQRPLDAILPLLGIPVTFEPADVTILLGDDARAYSDEELDRFLCMGLLVDDVAAAVLIERGRGHLLGGRFDGCVEGPCVERLTDPDFAGDYLGCDLPTDWFRLGQRGERISRWEPAAGAVVLSEFVDDRGETLAPAVTAFTNERGGRVAVLAQQVHPMGWLHGGRAAQVQALVAWLAGPLRGWPIVAEGPNIAPFVYRDPVTGERLVALVNAGLDPVEVDIARLGLVTTLAGDPAPARAVLGPLELWLGS